MKPAVVIAVLMFLPALASAEQITAESLCNSVAPPLMEFAAVVAKLPDGFDRAYNQLNAADQAKFEAAKGYGEDMALLAAAFRNEFMRACF